MIRIPSRYLLIGIVITSLMNLATIRKKEDPITKTQTSPIALNDKIQELKEGPKGAPTPSFRLYDKSKFFTDSPVDQKETKEEKQSQDEITELGRLSPEEEFQEEDWWMDEEDEESSAN